MKQKQVKNEVRNFPKTRFRQAEISQLCEDIYERCMAAGIDGLNVVLNILKDKTDYFNALIHPIMGSGITPGIVKTDENRDQKLVGFNHYIEFCVRHTNPEMVDAAKRIQVVLSNASYKTVYNDSYNVETNNITNLLEELRNNHAQDIETLQIGFYLDALEEDNNEFKALKAGRVDEVSRTYNYLDIQAARAEMEQALDAVRLQLNALAQIANLSGDAENYNSLISQINTCIAEAVNSSRSSKKDKENPAQPGNNNQDGENSGENGGDTGDNTPSADA